MQIPDKNTFNKRKWKNEGNTLIGVMRPEPSLEVSLVIMAMRGRAANMERRIIHYMRHSFYKSELNSSSVLRIKGLHLHKYLSLVIFPITTNSSEVRPVQMSTYLCAVSKETAHHFLTRPRVPEVLLLQNSLEYQGRALPLRTSVTMCRLRGREKIARVPLYTSPHLHWSIHQISQWSLSISTACGHHLVGRSYTSTNVSTCTNVSTHHLQLLSFTCSEYSEPALTSLGCAFRI